MVIRGNVIDANDEPIEWATILFVSGPVDLPDVAAVTDARGEFIVSVPSPGTYRLACHAESHDPLEVTTVVGGADVQLTFRIDGGVGSPS